MRRHVGICKTSGKRQYKHPLDAQLDHQHNPRTIHTYVCEHCRMWHASRFASKEEAESCA